MVDEMNFHIFYYNQCLYITIKINKIEKAENLIKQTSIF